MRSASVAILTVAAFCAIRAVAAPSARAADSPAAVEQLRCEYRVDPLGIDVTDPRLCWQMRDARRGARQTAYQVLVAATPEKLAAHEGDLWDSGRVESNQSTQVVYAGKPLGSRMRCHWKVRIWDVDGKPTACSKPALWTMGLLKAEDVKARWIGTEGPMFFPSQPADSAPTLTDCSWVWTAEPRVRPIERAPAGPRFFRRVLTLPAERVVRRAVVLATADDRFELFVNGKSLGGSGSWQSPKLIDITSHLVAGKNSLAIVAANDSPSPAGLCGKLVIEFQEGEPASYSIDGTWKASTKEEDGWKAADFDDSRWPSAVVIAPMGSKPWGTLSLSVDRAMACPLFRKEFNVGGPIRRATLYGSAQGIYQLYFNGKPVGDAYFTPDWTDYRKRIYYNTYDVTDMVRAGGANAIGGILSAGWFAGSIGWKLEKQLYGDKPRLFAQLEIELADGTVQTIATDDSWKTAFGPRIEGEFLAGETYDARREIRDWASPGLDEAAWKPVAVTDSIAARFEAFPGLYVQETGELRPVRITEPKPGAFVFDLGQNFAGFARLKAQGPAGTKVVLRFAEVLNPDGTIYTTNLRSARATDTYILKGQGEEVWQPHFTFHGFRYVEVTGYPGRPTKDAITGVVLNSNVPMTGSFECSSPMVNKLYQNILWTQRANFISVPTDCPQRDERLGWMGDAQTFVRAATYNADVAAFFTKWLVDVDDAQGPGGDFADVSPRIVDLNGGVAAWADAGTICPTTIYRVYNDMRLLAKHYPAMVRWVEYCRQHSKGLLRPNEGFGDWLSIRADTPRDVIATAYFAHSTRLTADAARVLGKEDDAKKYDELFQEIKAAFNKAYVAADGRIKGHTQTCYVMALWFDLLPAEKRAAAVRYLVDDIRSRKDHLSTGFVGTSMLMATLSSAGHTPLAYRLLLNDTFPSWGFSIKHGATSIWERWDGWTPEKGFQDPGMNSFAHYSFGAVAQWMFQTVAGIDTAEPGFQKLLIHPRPAEGLTWVKAAYRSIHGPIASEWRTEDGRLQLRVAIPANTTAIVVIPTSNPAAVTEGGKPVAEAAGVKVLPAESGLARLEVAAGDYQFVVP
jgi:alpha-L-rhamnosidase